MKILNEIFKGHTVSEKLQRILDAGNWNPNEQTSRNHFLKSDTSNLNYLKIKKSYKPLNTIQEEYNILRKKLGNIIPRSIFFESPEKNDPQNIIVICLTETLDILYDLGSTLRLIANFPPKEVVLPDFLKKSLEENPELKKSIDYFFKTLFDLANERIVLDMIGDKNLSLVKGNHNKIELRFLDNSDGYFHVSTKESLQDNGGYQDFQNAKTGWENVLLTLKKDRLKP